MCKECGHDAVRRKERRCMRQYAAEHPQSPKRRSFFITAAGVRQRLGISTALDCRDTKRRGRKKGIALAQPVKASKKKKKKKS